MSTIQFSVNAWRDENKKLRIAYICPYCDEHNIHVLEEFGIDEGAVTGLGALAGGVIFGPIGAVIGGLIGVNCATNLDKEVACKKCGEKVTIRNK
jgi:hypothetical protein